MNEIVAIQSALTSLKAAADIAKILRESTITLKDAETKFKLADLISALADAKIELARVQDTIEEQARTIRELQEKQAFAGNMKFEVPYYWNLDSGKRDGPYCQPCWDEKRLAARLYSLGNGSWTCKVCNKGFRDGSHRPPPPLPSGRGGGWMGN